jgi:hypothetical protein
MVAGHTTVAQDIDRASAEQSAENRRRLVPIENTIWFCGRQNIALRGRKDYGCLLEESSFNDDASLVKKIGTFVPC